MKGMKYILLGVAALFTINLTAQNMETPESTIIQLFVATDQNEWADVAKCFDSNVILDYSSMTGNPAAELSPAQIVEAWKGVMPGFESTHHQLGNFMVTEKENSAEVFCYGTASHYLNDEGGNVWIVVGTYDFELTHTANGAWKVSTMKFNFKYQDGNVKLAEKAMNRLN